MGKKSRLAFVYNVNSEVLEVKIKSSDRVIYKDACSVNDRKGISRIMKFLFMKGYIDIKDIKNVETETGWFD